jgi:hypothetical protein
MEHETVLNNFGATSCADGNVSMSFPGPLSYPAHVSYYYSYPPCCSLSPIHDPNTTQCDCSSSGNFAALGHRPPSFVQEHNVVSLYDHRDPEGRDWKNRWAGRNVSIEMDCHGSRHSFVAMVVDTCVNAHCLGCCGRGAHRESGFQIDLEYFTAMRNLDNSISCAADGELTFTF